MQITNNDFKLFGSAWTAPSWMKTNNKLSGIGFLNFSMYDQWSDYHLKFLQSYFEEGILLWGLTSGNEPANGYNEYITINDMGWAPSQLVKITPQPALHPSNTCCALSVYNSSRDNGSLNSWDQKLEILQPLKKLKL